MAKRAKFEYNVTLLYLLMGMLWLFLSGELRQHPFSFEVFNGVFFLILSALLLFFVIREYRTRLYKVDLDLMEEKQHLEKKVNDLNNQIKALQQDRERMDSKIRLNSSLLENISYKMRTPMNTISGFSQLLRDPNLSCETKANYTTIIENSCNQLLTVVGDTLTMASIVRKTEAVLIQEVDINRLLEEMTGIYHPQAINQSVRLEKSLGLPDEKARIYVDRNKLSQILGNLISNALKFTKEGSVFVGYEQNGQELVFTVRDTGIGIDPEKLETLFKRFSLQPEAVSQEANGTGLGLAICHSFVKMLEGSIRAESTPGKGSSFIFTLPYRPVLEKKTVTGEESDLRMYTILIVEDEYLNYLFLETLLTRTNFRLIWAKNGEEAIQYALTNPEINLVLMDIKLPRIDGYDAAIQIKKYRPDLPIIAQTAYALEVEKKQYDSIFDDYLTKPLNMEILRQRVVHYLQTPPSPTA